MTSLDFFSIDLILTAELGPGVYSASNRNEYQFHSITTKISRYKWKDNIKIILKTNSGKVWTEYKLA
jgi:hypothetical protein